MYYEKSWKYRFNLCRRMCRWLMEKYFKSFRLIKSSGIVSSARSTSVVLFAILIINHCVIRFNLEFAVHQRSQTPWTCMNTWAVGKKKRKKQNKQSHVNLYNENAYTVAHYEICIYGQCTGVIEGDSPSFPERFNECQRKAICRWKIIFPL